MNIRISPTDGYRARLGHFVQSFVAQVSALPFGMRMVPLLLFAWLLATWQLGASDLWLDEAISHWISTKPLAELLRFTMQQGREHPPLYYASLHFWMELAGTSEFAMRGFSALGSLLAVTLLATLARRWYNSRTAFLAALLMVTSPLWVFHARDARMYSWLAALALLNIYALDRSLFQPRRRDWILFFASLFLMLGTQYFSGLLLISYGLYLLILWRYLPRPVRWQLALLLISLGLLGGGWIVSQPGPRESLLGAVAFALSAQRSWARLFELIAHWSLGNIIFTWPAGLVWLCALPLWLLALIGMRTAGRPKHGKANLPLLLTLLIPAPILLAFSILPTTHPRHVMSTFGLYALALALGIGYIGRRGRAILTPQPADHSGAKPPWYTLLPGLGVFVVVMGINLVLAFDQIVPISHPFSAPLQYIAARARADESILYTYYFEWPLDNYYNQRRLPSRQLVNYDTPITQEDANARAEEAFKDQSSLWLVLYPGPENTDRLEQAFNRIGFPTGRTWFAGDRGVVHYFSARPLQEHPTAMSWENGIGLPHWWGDGESVAAGDALRLQFDWQPNGAVANDALMVLNLRGADQMLWATQTISPCNGRCPTGDWADDPVTDRLAFYISPDIPPGVYELRVGWVNSTGLPSLGLLTPEAVKQVDVPLMQVTVLPPAQSSAMAPAPPLDQTVGLAVGTGLTLTSIGFGDPTVRSGAALAIPMQFTVSDKQPQLDVQLLLDGDGQRYTLNVSIGPTWYPSPEWTPGDTVRVQPQFQIPRTLAPGPYAVSLAVAAPNASPTVTAIPIGVLRLEDRPRRVDVPDLGTAIDASCNDGIRLARFMLQETAYPGSQIPLTLIWQADGPPDHNWKVFAHLLDDQEIVRSQADDYPMGGKALTSSWQQGEVIVDEHQFILPADLPVGSYRVRIGFYDEITGDRLLCGNSQSIILPSPLDVRAP